jgi:hypothetical protein
MTESTHLSQENGTRKGNSSKMDWLTEKRPYKLEGGKMELIRAMNRMISGRKRKRSFI